MLQDKYINPLTDFGFKKLFGSEPNKDLLIDFLNQLLPTHHTIKDLSYSSNEHLSNTELDRKAIFDIFCESTTGEKFIVEIQKSKQNYFKDRSIYYSTFPIQQQAKKGDWDFKLTAVYTIGILDFVFDEHKNDSTIIHTVKLKDQSNHVFYDKLTFIYIELPKFDKTTGELHSKIDKWLFVFRYLAQLQNHPITLQEKIFEKLFKAAEIAKFSPEEQESYEKSLKYYRDIKNVVDTAKEEGLEEGLEKGRKEGLEKGRKERNIEIAKAMKQSGVPIEVIAKTTGLSITKIEAL